jgi:hypothetical protein
MLREQFALIAAESALRVGCNQIDDPAIGDVSSQVVRLNEVIARIKIAVVFEGESRTASLVKQAHPGTVKPHPLARSGLEGLDEDPTRRHDAHSSNTPLRKRPYCAAEAERSETSLPR